MMVCPACSSELSPALDCRSCGWQVTYRQGVPALLVDTEPSDATMRDYFESYDQVATIDLDGKIMDERYIENLASNFCERVERVAGATICDIGSGKGFLARKLLGRGAASVTAIDISLAYLLRLTDQPGICPMLANAEALPFTDHFDIIVSSDVLEHVVNVASFLYCVNRALRPNGYFYVRVPYRENLLSYSPLLGCPTRFGHLRTYDRPLLRQALTEAGFVVERVWCDGYVPDLARRFWRGSSLGQKLHKHYLQRLRERGGNQADVTRLPHGLRPILLKPTVVIAAARKVKRLVPMGGGRLEDAQAPSSSPPDHDSARPQDSARRASADAAVEE
jgi:SAM-dependent methyltransferase